MNTAAEEHRPPAVFAWLAAALVVAAFVAAALCTAGCEHYGELVDDIRDAFHEGDKQQNPTNSATSATSGGSSASGTASGSNGGSAAGAPSPGGAYDWCYGGFKGGAAVEDPAVQIADLRISASGMTYRFSKGDLSAWGIARTDADAIAAAFFWDDAAKKWRGGKFDWISTSRLSRDWENIRCGYGGWDAAAFFAAERHAFCIVSKDGRRRTNFITDN
ncbi:MAG: hypothetical protein IJ678_06095 [Kiritimatiellae bacterium]|nr:hypothetical protein [Kiritimatiellia bacterium]